MAERAQRHGRHGCSGSTMRSICATASSTTSPRKSASGKPVDVTTGYVNVIWQGDANAMALRCLAHAKPIAPLNVTGPEDAVGALAGRALRANVRQAAEIVGEEAPTAWLNNAARRSGCLAIPRCRCCRWSIGWPTGLAARCRALASRPASRCATVAIERGRGRDHRADAADIDDGLALSTEAGWNQTEADWG